jgi:hypothetical protein
MEQPAFKRPGSRGPAEDMGNTGIVLRLLEEVFEAGQLRTMTERPLSLRNGDLMGVINSGMRRFDGLMEGDDGEELL